VSARAAPKEYQRGRWHAVENTVMSALTRAGLIPGTYLLTTTGRKTGQPRTNPVTIVKHDSRRWLVAPYGAVPWVLNARASGDVGLSRRGKSRRFVVREVSAEEAGPVLKRYAAVATASRPYFGADKDAPVDAFTAEADKHPVFELIPAEPLRRKRA
jgi:deazaflavin-dependent oxidoreductase (nitroreductase family)